MTKLAQRFIERAVLEADEAGCFDPNKMIRRLNINEFELNEVAQELVRNDVLIVSYARDGAHRWQLLGRAREQARERARLKLEPGVAIKAAPAPAPVIQRKPVASKRAVAPAVAKRAAKTTLSRRKPSGKK